MQPTEILMSEHRIIEVVLECLEKLSQAAIADKRLNREQAEAAVDFIKNFADKCHHAKEEGQLFPVMINKGLPAKGGPVGVMLAEHEQGRDLTKKMADQIQAAAEGNEKAIADFDSYANMYVQLLRMHIHKENNILFPMADRLMSAEDNQALKKQFEVVEKEHIGQGIHEKYRAIALDLAKKYEVATDAIENTGTESHAEGHHADDE
jgi:hemerythrin-like domain-containing protein